MEVGDQLASPAKTLQTLDAVATCDPEPLQIRVKIPQEPASKDLEGPLSRCIAGVLLYLYLYISLYAYIHTYIHL